MPGWRYNSLMGNVTKVKRYLMLNFETRTHRKKKSFAVEFGARDGCDDKMHSTCTQKRTHTNTLCLFHRGNFINLKCYKSISVQKRLLNWNCMHFSMRCLLTNENIPVAKLAESRAFYSLFPYAARHSFAARHYGLLFRLFCSMPHTHTRQLNAFYVHIQNACGA